jgi:hypothetical protein
LWDVATVERGDSPVRPCVSVWAFGSRRSGSRPVSGLHSKFHRRETRGESRVLVHHGAVSELSVAHAARPDNARSLRIQTARSLAFVICSANRNSMLSSPWTPRKRHHTSDRDADTTHMPRDAIRTTATSAASTTTSPLATPPFLSHLPRPASTSGPCATPHRRPLRASLSSLAREQQPQPRTCRTHCAPVIHMQSSTAEPLYSA